MAWYPWDNNPSSIKFNEDGGIGVRLINKTGTATVKGSLVNLSSQYSRSVKLTPLDSPGMMGVVYESGVSDGEECWVIVGGIADVLFVNAVTCGQFARGCVSSDSDAEIGKAIGENFPTPPFVTDQHFMEIGHILTTTTGPGLAKVLQHWN